jgi:hypothetical protein
MATNVAVINASPECIIVRSVYVWDDVDDYVEIGWYQDGADQSVTVCTNTTTPHILVFQYRNGAASCRQNTPLLTVGQDYSFKVPNPEHDLDFHFFWDTDLTPDVPIGAYMTGHSNGMARTGTEHHSASGSLRADFRGFNSLGGQGNWHPYSGAYVNVFPPLGGYVVCSWGDTYLHVRANGNC